MSREKTSIDLLQPESQIRIETTKRLGQNNFIADEGNFISEMLRKPDQEPEKEKQPYLVNPRQYKRILKRRQQKQDLEDRGLLPKERKKYLHESRHRHAMMRNRCEGGRFNSGSTKTKLQALKNCEERRKLKEAANKNS